MEAAKCQISGSDYIGAFATSTDDYTFVPIGLPGRITALIENTLKTKCVVLPCGGVDLIGLFCRANSNGIAMSNIATDEDVAAIKKMDLGINVEIIDSNINAIGNAVLANDKIAFIDSEYTEKEAKQIEDLLGVEVVRMAIGGFRTVGATNIFTNKGFVINNHGTDKEKGEIDRLTGFESVSTTANTGSLSIGLASISNSNGLLVGDETTGFEMNRILQGLGT